jgi:hypothetical protein
MSLLVIALIVLIALALLGGVGFRGGARRSEVVGSGPRYGYGVGSSSIGIVVFVLLIVLIVSLLN